MRNLLVTVVALLAPSATAQEFASPDDLLSTLYQAYMSAPVTNLEPYFSESLTAGMNGGRLDMESLERLGFDPIMGSEVPSLVTFFNLDTIETKGLTATSVAHFNNAGQPVSVTFRLVREGDHGWQIDHISGQSGSVSWCSNDLIAAVQSPNVAN